MIAHFQNTRKLNLKNLQEPNYARHAFFELFRSVLETMSDRNQDGGARLRLGPPGRLLCAMSDRYDAIYCVPASAARARVCLPRCGWWGGGGGGHKVTRGQEPGHRWSPAERERARHLSVRSVVRPLSRVILFRPVPSSSSGAFPSHLISPAVRRYHVIFPSFATSPYLGFIVKSPYLEDVGVSEREGGDCPVCKLRLPELGPEGCQPRDISPPLATNYKRKYTTV